MKSFPKFFSLEDENLCVPYSLHKKFCSFALGQYRYLVCVTCVYRAHQTHYEQMGRLDGTVVIDGHAHVLRLDSMRDHSYGNTYTVLHPTLYCTLYIAQHYCTLVHETIITEKFMKSRIHFQEYQFSLYPKAIQ